MQLKSEKLTAVTSSVNDLTHLPRIVTGFYLLIIDEGWPTTASLVLRESADVLQERLREHTVVNAKGDLICLLKDKYDLDLSKQPIMVVTDIHPADYNRADHKEHGLQLNLGSVRDRDDLAGYMKRIADTVDKQDFLNRLTWFDRKTRLMSILENIPVLEIINLI